MTLNRDSVRLLEALVEAPSPSGHEGPAAKVFREHLAQYADEVSVDVSGNVFAALNASAPVRIMLAGHLDEVGFVVTSIDDSGLLSFQPIGDCDPAIAAGQRVWVHGRDRLPGGIGSKPIHLQGKGADARRASFEELWIDIGAASRSEAEKVVEIGDPVTCRADFQVMQGHRAIARGFDNKAGAFVVAEVMRLLKEKGGLQEGVGVVGVGTVQEEIGFRGAATAAFNVDARTGIAIDVAHATDVPGLERLGRVELGKGPVIARGAYLSPVVARMLKDSAREEGIACQSEAAASATESDATSMQSVRGGLAAGLVSIPLRAMHTPCEVLDLRDVEACVRLVAAYCRRIRSDSDFTPW